MPKKKKTMVNGIIIDDGLIFSYDDPNDFQEAYPGICLWLAVRENEKISNPAYKGVDNV